MRYDFPDGINQCSPERGRLGGDRDVGGSDIPIEGLEQCKRNQGEVIERGVRPTKKEDWAMPTESGRGGLEDIPFSYSKGNNGGVLISWRGRQVAILRGAKAVLFLQRVSGLDISDQQMVMAKVTGNFKRGNERLAGK